MGLTCHGETSHRTGTGFMNHPIPEIQTEAHKVKVTCPGSWRMRTQIPYLPGQCPTFSLSSPLNLSSSPQTLHL